MIYNQKDVRTMEGKVYIGRGSVFGNPYVIGKDGTREEVIVKYEKYIWNAPRVLARIPELVGKDLVCHCKPKACHGDVLVNMVQLFIGNKLPTNNSHILGIVGTRSFKDYDLFEKYLDAAINRLQIEFNTIVSGGADGPDTLAEEYSKRRNIKFIKYPAEWNKYGKRAGFIRNTTIVENSTMIIAFWDHNSSGTFDTINKSIWFNKELHTIDIRKLK